ncbi:hypothetical protein [Bacillus taeanensis]|uniref:Uncharacterized protein n=1 Tax=Bacillus taeanensis TaxID=273032 RepID=A0A366Y4A2_9BACI|nr:hypothetical protein [Bacillus taeanensis]RBW71021.1 hypothetical protein DS031_03240 [Bacillus taeanensis]
MDEKIFTQALVSLKGNELRIAYVMFCRTSILDIMASMLSNTFINSDHNYFTNQIEKEVKNLKGKKDEELQFELMEEISKVLNLYGGSYSNKAEIEERALDIVNKTCEMLKNHDKSFRSLCEANTQISSLNIVIKWQLNELINSFNKRFQKMMLENQKEFSSKINDYIYGLPNDQQQKIKQKLGIEDFSEELMRRKMETSGLSIVFSIIAETSSFSFYNQLLHLFAQFSKAFGFTLPFSISSNPLVIIPSLVGGGALLYKKQSKSLQKRLLPFTILQIVLPYMSEQSNNLPTLEPLINTWNIIYERYRRVEKQLSDQKQKIEETESILSQTKTIIQRLQHELKEVKSLLHTEKNKITVKLKETSFNELRLLAVSTKFELVLDSYIKTVEKIDNRNYKKVSKRQQIDFFDKLKTAIEKWDLNVEINQLEKEADKHLQRLTAELSIYYSSFVGLEHKAIQHYEKTKQLLIKQLSEQKEKESLLFEEIMSQKQEERYLKKRKDNLEKEHYSLNHLEGVKQV